MVVERRPVVDDATNGRHDVRCRSIDVMVGEVKDATILHVHENVRGSGSGSTVSAVIIIAGSRDVIIFRRRERGSGVGFRGRCSACAVGCVTRGDSCAVHASAASANGLNARNDGSGSLGHRVCVRAASELRNEALALRTPVWIDDTVEAEHGSTNNVRTHLNETTRRAAQQTR